MRDATTSGGLPVTWGTKGGGPWQTTEILFTRNVVWGRLCGGADCLVLPWDAHTMAATSDGEEDTVVWGTSDGEQDTVVWGTNDGEGDTVVWGTSADGDTVVWGTSDGDTVVWGTTDGDTVVWGTSCDDPSCEPVVWQDGQGQ